jgi:hypothetical protein
MHLRALCLAVTTAMTVLDAHAGRPLQTEDAGVLEPGAWELELAHSRVRLGAARAHDTSVQLARGIGWDSQFALAVGRARSGGERADSAAALGKTELWNNGNKDGAAALTLAWAVTGIKAGTDGWRHAATDLTLVYSRPLAGGLTLHANLGHARDEFERIGSTGWGLALEHDGVAVGDGRLAPMAELFGDDRGSRWWNTGLRWTVRPDAVWLDASFGREFASQPATLVTFGLKIAF